jgi:hypothetical protein
MSTGRPGRLAPAVVARRVAYAFLVLLTACSGGGIDRPEAATPAAEPTVSAITTAAESSCPPRVCDGPLPPGDYLSESLGVTLTFRVDDGWIGGADIPDEGFFLQDRTARAPAAMSVMRFPGDVFTDPCAVGSTEPVSGADALVMWLEDHDSLEVNQVTPTEVAGRPATQVDATTTVPAACPDPVVFLWPLPVSREFHFNDGETVRLLVVDLERFSMVVVLEAFPGADPTEFFARAQAVLDTMEISE